MAPHPSAAEPRLDLTAATIAGFFFAMLPLAAVVISLCIAELGAR